MKSFIINGEQGNIECFLHHSDDNKDKQAVLILPPNDAFKQNFHNGVIKDIFITVAKSGYTTLGMHYSGMEKSQGNFSSSEEEVLNVSLLIDWFLQNNHNIKDITIIGMGLGGDIALNTMMRRPGINKFIIFNPEVTVNDVSKFDVCPVKGAIIFGTECQNQSLSLANRIKLKIGGRKSDISVVSVKDANCCFVGKENKLIPLLKKYL